MGLLRTDTVQHRRKATLARSVFLAALVLGIGFMPQKGAAETAEDAVQEGAGDDVHRSGEQEQSGSVFNSMLDRLTETYTQVFDTSDQAAGQRGQPPNIVGGDGGSAEPSVASGAGQDRPSDDTSSQSPSILIAIVPPTVSSSSDLPPVVPAPIVPPSSGEQNTPIASHSADSAEADPSLDISEKQKNEDSSRSGWFSNIASVVGLSSADEKTDAAPPVENKTEASQPVEVLAKQEATVAEEAAPPQEVVEAPVLGEAVAGAEVGGAQTETVSEQKGVWGQFTNLFATEGAASESKEEAVQSNTNEGNSVSAVVAQTEPEKTTALTVDSAPPPEAAPVAAVQAMAPNMVFTLPPAGNDGLPKVEKAEPEKVEASEEKKELTPKQIAEQREKTSVDETKRRDAMALLMQETLSIRKLVGHDGVVTLNIPSSTAMPDVLTPVGLNEAVLFSLKNNSEISASNEKYRGSQWDKYSAYAEMGPAVSLSYTSGAERSMPGSYNDSNGDRVKDDTHHRRDRTVTVRQPLIDPAVVADILMAEDKQIVAAHDDHDARQGIAADTVVTYFKLVQARVAVELADQYKSYLDILAKKMKIRVDGGGATQADLERIKSRSTMANSARVEALGDYETNLTDFKRLTGVVPTGLRLPEILAPEIPADPQIALERALRANPIYLASLGKIDTAADDRNKVISTMLPKLSFQYSNNYTYNAGGAAKGNPVDGSYPNDRSHTYMLVAEWQLGSGAPIAAAMSSAAKEREMKHRANDTRVRLEQSVRAGYTAVNAATERIIMLRENVESNEKIVTAFDEQFANGNRTLFELLDAYEQLYNSRLNLMRVTLAKAQAMYQIRKQMGELVPAVAGRSRN